MPREASAAERIFRKKVRLVNHILSRMPQGAAVYAPEKRQLVYCGQKFLDACGFDSENRLAMLLQSRFCDTLPEPGSFDDTLNVPDGEAFPVHCDVYTFEGETLVQLTCGQVPIGQVSVPEEEHAESASVLVNALQGEYNELYLLSPSEKQLRSLNDGTYRQYEDWAQDLLRNRCHPSDREAAAQQLLLPQVLTGISYNGRCEVQMRLLSGTDQYQYAMVRFLPSGTVDDDILCGIMNVDEAMQKELQVQSQLARALEDARSANNAKTVFLSNMSHDIRTPMNAIKGFTDLAIRNIGDNEKTLDYLQKIGAASAHLLNLINDVLDMSRIESGKMHISEEKADVLQVVHELCDMLRPEAEGRGLRFQFTAMDVHNTGVFCDVLRLKQLLLNLLSNAVKFTPRGGTVFFGIREKPFTMPGSVGFEFTVRDTGVGMSSDFMERLFTPFERERTSTVSGIQGTGLGMSICKSITDMMGGTIDVSSEAGKGTLFTVNLRFKLADLGAEARQSRKEADISIAGMRILLVEDNELNREIATELLEDEGVMVESAENGQIGVNMLAEKPPHYYNAVLMDVQMPVMDGYTAAREIRAMADKDKANVVIVAMTANAFAEDRQNAFAAGMNAHISKPINIDVIRRTLNTLLG